MLKIVDWQVFSYLLFIPVIWVLIFFWGRHSLHKFSQKIGNRAEKHLAFSVSKSRRRWRLILQSIVLFLFIGALSRPQMGQKTQEVKNIGIELILLFDVSASMLAEDVKPNRLEHAKKELAKLIDLRGGDRVGIIAFAGSAVMVAPITSDKAALHMYIESLATNTISTQGTDLVKALELSQSAFTKGGVEADEKVRVTRAVILASDGEHNEQDIVAAMKTINQDNIKVFTLAFGTERGGVIPIRDEHGYLKGHKNDRLGQEVVTKVNGALLKKIAQAGRGSFYHVTYGGDVMKQLADDLAHLGKVEFSSSTVTEYDEYYQFILLWAVIIALLELIVGDRKRATTWWSGRFELPRSGQ